MLLEIPNILQYNDSTMNNSPINSTINSTTVGELADATSLSGWSKIIGVDNF